MYAFLQLLLPCANAKNPGGKCSYKIDENYFQYIISCVFSCVNKGKVKKVAKAMAKGTKETAKVIGKSAVNLASSVAGVVGSMTALGGSTVATGLAIGCCPLVACSGSLEKSVEIVKSTSTTLAGSVVGVVGSGVDVGVKTATAGAAVLGCPCICAQKSWKAMKEMKEKEEMEEKQEETLNKIKQLYNIPSDV